ncbi:MAG TPA: permease [Galbitalea sp.]
MSIAPPAQSRETDLHRGRSVTAPGRSKVLIVALVLTAALVGVRLLSPLFVPSGLLPDRAQDGLTLGISVLVESMPFVVLGIVFSIVVRVWLPEGLWVRVLPKSPILRRAVVSLIGMLLPVCECGNVPLARGLMVRGLTVAESMTFLFAAPIVNPITIITTYQAFGFSNGILVARIVGGFFVANLLGWIFSRHPAPESLLTARFAAECRLPAHEEHGSRWSRSVELFGREAANLLPALFIGAVAASLVQTVVPRSTLVALGSDPVWSVVAMLALSFIISVCSTVDAFFILPFASTFLPGAIVAFLVFGALIDIRMLALLRTTFTTKTLAQLLVIIVLTAAALAWLVNIVA